MRQLSTLYKKTSLGKIQTWMVHVLDDSYFTVTGQIDGKKITNKPTACKGKNTGKANATTAYEQAGKEAHAKWIQQLKKGYVECLAEAEKGMVNKEYVKGGYSPLLAETFQDFEKEVQYPCYGQPKLDGHRGTNDNGLFSRTRKPIMSCPHILEEIQRLDLMSMKLDGELYNHFLRDEFEKLSSAIRKSTPQPECEIVQYYIYDIFLDNIPFKDRVHSLNLLDTLLLKKGAQHLKVVPTEIVHNAEHAFLRTKYWINQGYEGYMLRNPDACYENKRSKNLLKLKIWQDAEFKIVGINEGKGKLAGHVGTFTCEIDDKLGRRTFKAKAKGSYTKLREYWLDHSLWENKLLTVKFINYTKKNVVPRHGVGKEGFKDLDY